MEIYVDELPKCCLVCKMACPEEQRCVDGFTMDCDYCGVSERPASCPLKPLTDIELKYYNGQILHSEFASLENKIRAEERKKVVQEIRNYMENHSHIVPVISKKRNVIYKIGLNRFLDQIERNIDG